MLSAGGKTARPPATVFEACADALHAFSLDLVKLVHGYLVWPTATARARPKLLTFGSEGDEDSTIRGSLLGIACSLDKIWVSCSYSVQAFSVEGKFLHQADAFRGLQLLYGIAVDAHGEAFCADYHGKRIVVCRPDGSFARQISGTDTVELSTLSSLAIDSKQDILFTTANERVSVVKLDGSFVRAFGGEGNGEGSANRCNCG